MEVKEWKQATRFLCMILSSKSDALQFVSQLIGTNLLIQSRMNTPLNALALMPGGSTHRIGG